MNRKKQSIISLFGGLAVAALLACPKSMRANVYATDIQINATLTGTNTVSVGIPASITYHLNDNAAAVTVKIRKTNLVVASFAGTTNMGINTVSWTPTNAGNFSVSITASSAGYPTWQQISPLTTNYAEVYPLGMAVDNNSNSPYYGRVVVSCSANTATPVHGIAQLGGLYKYNADGTPADEGSFGYANFTTNDLGITAVGQMPTTHAPFFQVNTPSCVRIGEDDRIYWSDNSDGGAIVACDMQAMTNQVIIGAGNSPSGDHAGFLVGPSYDNCANIGYINQGTVGWIQFDIINTGTASTYTGTNGVYTGSQAALILNDWDFPSAGVWMWHLVGAPGSMTVDPTDSYGQQIVDASSGDVVALRTDGVVLDYNLDVFVGQLRNDPTQVFPKTVAWTNWNGGVLPPGDQGGAQGGGLTYGLTTQTPYWAEGVSSPATATNDADIFDLVLNSKSNPTLLARAHNGGPGFGLDLLIPLEPKITITGVTLSGTNLTIGCTSSSPYAPDVSQVSLLSSSTVNGTYLPVAATFSGSNGVFQATTPKSGPTGFYKVAWTSVAGTTPLGSIVTIQGSGPVTNSLAFIDYPNIYHCGLAFDNVGNLYGANPSDNYWRVWSPPGPNTNTTVAVASLTAH